ncbi:MAG: hypothetical protein ACRC2H_13510 [Silanimonas sp.]
MVNVLTIIDIGWAAPTALLARFGLELVEVQPGETIPGSYWGDCEAGIIGSRVYARGDTPVHSLLHEAGHLVVMPPERRAGVHTDAGDTPRDEDAVCCLQLLLSDELPGFGRERAFADMDAWGYTFRLGSAKAWYENDAEDAFESLYARPHLSGLLPATNARRDFGRQAA